MRLTLRLFVPVLTLALALAVAPAAAQDGPSCFLANATHAEAAERASPLDSASVSLGGDVAKICYGAPSARGRDIMGGLVPYGQPWRSGANEATGLHLEFQADIGGVEVDPGSYSLYTIPGEDTWEVVLNGNYERWGIPIDQGVRQDDIGIVTVRPGSTDGMVEQLRYRWDKQGESAAHLILEWENTRLRIPVEKAGM